MRNNATHPESLLWDRLKSKQLNGLKFRRQHSIGHYVLDFYCPQYKLAIELDGPSHFSSNAKRYDRVRQEYIEDCDIHFLRFTNQEIFENLESVLEKITEFIHSN